MGKITLRLVPSNTARYVKMFFYVFTMVLQELDALMVEIDVGVAVYDFYCQILICVGGSSLTCVEFKIKP
jgi:hypothetical protein